MSLPLLGKKILVTRAQDQAKAFSDKLKEAGAIPLMAPLLTFQSRLSKENQQLFQELHDFTWVFFTSANGVKFFLKQLDHLGMEYAVLDKMKIAVVGTKTNNMLHTYGYTADFQPGRFLGKDMVIEFLNKYSKHERILLVCGNIAREEIRNELAKQQVYFRRAVVYDTLINEESRSLLLKYLEEDEIDVFTFTSPSIIEAFIQLTKDKSLEVESIKNHSLCVCIGSTTAKKAFEVGFQQVHVPDEFTTVAMIEELITYYTTEG